MPTYRVRFECRVHRWVGTSSVDATFYRDVELPFPPFVGLTVMDGDWNATAVEVSVDLLSGQIACYVKPDTSAVGKSDDAFQEAVQYYLDEGWDRLE